MRRKALTIGGIVLGVLALFVMLGGPAASLLGIEPICIQGEFPHLRVVPCPDSAASRPASTPIPLPTLSESRPIPVIVDDDGSPDGMIALLYFLRHPHYDVRAVTVSPGEAHPELFAQHLTRLLAAVGRSDIPVGAGRADPLQGDNAFPDPWRENSDAFWGISLPDAPSSAGPVPAADLIVETASGSSRPVLIFVAGPHTNLAEALRLEPSIVERILSVNIMGGSIHVPGNIQSDWPAIKNRVAEWNIWVDPVAAQEVFASGIPLNVMPLDGSNRIIWTESDARSWASSGTAEGAFGSDLLRWMLDNWSQDGVYVWDLAAAVATTDQNLCPTVALALEIQIEPGAEQGRTFISQGIANTSVCLQPDPAQIRARAAAILGK